MTQPWRHGMLRLSMRTSVAPEMGLSVEGEKRRRAPELTGHCLCEAIVVRIAASPAPMVLCHCSQCRKTAGAPFNCVFPIPRAHFELDDSLGLLREFRSSPNKARYFCRRCGAAIYSMRENADSVRVRAGLFEQLDYVTFSGHIFMRDAAPWYIDCDEMPRYQALEPARADTALTNKAGDYD
jgi:hypothetical protein